VAQQIQRIKTLLLPAAITRLLRKAVASIDTHFEGQMYLAEQKPRSTLAENEGRQSGVRISEKTML
jgi:hypothetical protein